MKINFNIWSAGITGGNRTIYELINGLAKKDHKITVTALALGGTHEWFGKVDAEFNYIGLNLIQKAFRKYFYIPNFEVDWAQALAKAIPECDINVATHCNTVYPTLWSKKGKPIYLIQHDERIFFEKGTLDYALADLSYTFSRRFLEKVTVSRWLQQQFTSEYRIGNGINTNKFYNIGIPKFEKPTVLLFKTGAKFKDVYDVSELQKQLMNKNIDVIIIKKQTSEIELLKLYNKCWFTVFCSSKEGFGLIPLESMACGTPVITNLQGTDYEMNNNNTYQIKETSTKEIVKAIEKAIENESEYYEKQKKGLELVKSFNFKNVVDKFETILENYNGRD